jgi:large subunit ribosomal protein L16
MQQNIQPKKMKFKKHFKLRKMKGVTKDSGLLDLGDYGIKITESGVLTAKQIWTLHTNLQKNLRKLDKNVSIIWKCFPHIPVSKKPAETRMGSGKGGVEFFATRVLKGKVILGVLFSNSFVPEESILEEMESSINVLPMKSKVFKRFI